MKNFKMEKTSTGTWVVRADSKRFGRKAIVFESYKMMECVAWIKEKEALLKVAANQKEVEA